MCIAAYKFCYKYDVILQRKSNSPVSAQPIQKQQSLEDHEDSDSDKRRKSSKQKWVPLDIDLTKSHSKRDHSPRRRSDRSSEAQSTVSDGDRDWRAELRESVNHTGLCRFFLFVYVVSKSRF